jgi:hypothetical protein
MPIQIIITIAITIAGGMAITIVIMVVKIV